MLIGFSKLRRHKRLFVFALAVFVIALAYYPLTYRMINSCAADLGRPHMGCIYLLWNSGDETRFLINMKERAVPVVKRQLARPDLGLKMRIHFAWILSNIGDHSYFHTFIDGLESDRSDDQFIACSRMRDFPDQCRKYQKEILSVPGERKHENYWNLVLSFSDSQKDRLQEIVFKHRNDKSPLTPDEQQEILNMPR